MTTAGDAMTPAQIHRKVLRLFRWAPDIDTFGATDWWESFADQVERGETFTGDCDNFAMTCAELALRSEHPPNTIQLALCYVETGGYHAVCFVGSECLDNRHRSAIRWHLLPYRWDRSMFLSEPSVWRKMVT